MDKQLYEKLLNIAINNGADFAEIYDEKSLFTCYNVLDSKLDSITTKNRYGIGIRVKKNKCCYYASTNNRDEDNLIKVVNDLTKKFKSKTNNREILLTNPVDKTKKCNLHSEMSIDDKKKILLNLDKVVRNYSKYVKQASLSFLENYKEFTICNSNGKYVKSKRYYFGCSC